MSIIIYCTKLRLSKYKGLWFVFIKQNMNFKFQLPSTFLFVFHKSGPIKSCSSFEDVQIKNFNVPR
jgi:hypothetical protein